METSTPIAAKPPIINCHTHIFTGDHVPPYLAKSFLPPPLYFLLNLRWIVWGFRKYYKYIKPLKFGSWSKTSQKRAYEIKIFIARNFLVKWIARLVGLWLTVHAFFILFDLLAALAAPDSSAARQVGKIRSWLEARHLLFLPASGWLRAAIVVAVLLFVESGRNLILFVFKKIWSFFRILPGPQTKALIKRYINIGRFSFHHKQSENYEQLRNQYPPDTGFVVLPMDMEFMGAGKLKKNFRYRSQMADLKKIKENAKYTHRFFPFVFVDPRRIRAEQDFFAYRLTDNKIVLENCFLKDYFEPEESKHRFSGFKIYPALGYYPFDYSLLPLWKYAADRGLPIMTHCIRGNIFYRGAKEKAWDNHPVFEQSVAENKYGPLLLSQMKNIEFINNFTHPLNFLCLLEETILRKWVGKGGEFLRELFGYTNDETKLGSDLSGLKICFGHYGGNDEWNRFMESDRDNHSSQMVKMPDKGIEFLDKIDGTPGRGKPEQIWRNADWYTIVSSLMLQYDNVYSDLSYILHDEEILPLLFQTMQNRKLRKRVLFGTDFYVVRNHKSEKNMLAGMQSHLCEADFDRIARENPRQFLKSCVEWAAGEKPGSAANSTIKPGI